MLIVSLSAPEAVPQVAKTVSIDPLLTVTLADTITASDAVGISGEVEMFEMFGVCPFRLLPMKRSIKGITNIKMYLFFITIKFLGLGIY
jgi:hypothetical protein